jgi:iron complex outermembrane receptor protein
VSLSRSATAAAACSLLGLACASPVFAQASPAGDADAQRIVVTATRFPENADSLPFGVGVVTSADIQAAGIVTVNEALMKLLGVPGRLDFYGGGDYALDLRGFGGTADSNQVVIVDGVRLSEADLSGTRLAGIPVNQIDRIEVIRGSGAVLYGEGATGGVIVITSKGAAGRVRREGEAYAAYGRYDTRDLQADASLPLGAFALDLAASKHVSDNHRDNFHSDAGAASVGGHWQLDGWRLGAQAAHDELSTGLPGALTAQQYADNPRQTNNPDDKATIRNDRQVLSAQGALAGWDLAFEAGWRQKALDSLQFLGGSPSPYAFDIRADNQSLRARRELDFAGARHALIAGLDFSAWHRQVEGDFGTLARQRSNALYAQDEIEWNSGTRVALGARTEQLRKSVTGTDARVDQRENAWELGLTQQLGAGWSAYGRIGRSYRLPNADEFNFTTPGTALVAQTSTDTELGARYGAAAWRAELRAYRSALRHEIGFDPNAVGPFGPGGANVNFDPTVRQGVELEAHARLAPAWGATLNAALRQARFAEGPYDGKQVPLTAKGTAALHVDWRVLPGQRLDAGLRHVSSQHPDFANQCAMPAYTTADARYSVQWGDFEFALKVDNLADRKFYTQAFACSGGVTTSIYPEAGRSATASVRWTFL